MRGQTRKLRDIVDFDGNFRIFLQYSHRRGHHPHGGDSHRRGNRRDLRRALNIPTRELAPLRLVRMGETSKSPIP